MTFCSARNSERTCDSCMESLSRCLRNCVALSSCIIQTCSVDMGIPFVVGVVVFHARFHVFHFVELGKHAQQLSQGQQVSSADEIFSFLFMTESLHLVTESVNGVLLEESLVKHGQEWSRIERDMYTRLALKILGYSDCR